MLPVHDKSETGTALIPSFSTAGFVVAMPMINISVNDVVGDFSSGKVDVLQVNAADGRTFAVSVSVDIRQSTPKEVI